MTLGGVRIKTESKSLVKYFLPVEMVGDEMKKLGLIQITVISRYTYMYVEMNQHYICRYYYICIIAIKQN